MNRKGFSLMELMIVVVVVGILAAIAIPSYTSYIQRGRMAQAYADIQTAALANEKCFAETNRYLSKSTTNYWTSLSSSYGLKIPQDTKYYSLNITSTGVIYADNTSNSIVTSPIKRIPCMRSDGVQGYSKDEDVPVSLDDCVSEEWRGK